MSLAVLWQIARSCYNYFYPRIISRDGYGTGAENGFSRVLCSAAVGMETTHVWVNILQSEANGLTGIGVALLGASP